MSRQLLACTSMRLARLHYVSTVHLTYFADSSIIAGLVRAQDRPTVLAVVPARSAAARLHEDLLRLLEQCWIVLIASLLLRLHSILILIVAIFCRLIAALRRLFFLLNLRNGE